MNKLSLVENARVPYQICRLQEIVSFATLRPRIQIITAVCLRDLFLLEYNATSRGKGLHSFRRSVVFFPKSRNPLIQSRSVYPKRTESSERRVFWCWKVSPHTHERNAERFTLECICKKAKTNQRMLCEFRFWCFYVILAQSLDLI